MRGTAAIALEGGGGIDHDIVVRIEQSAEVAREEIVASLAAEVQRNARAFPSSVGVVGLLQPLGSPGTRPGFTLVVSSPHGGSEAARVFLRGFEERGISGLLARQIQNNKFGLIRGLFLPEWLSHFRDRNAGIDWEVWQTAARLNFDKNFYDAMLVWSDEILRSVLDLQGKAGLLIDRVFFDSYSAVVLLGSNVEQTLKEISRLSEPDSFSASEICHAHIK